MLFLDDVEWELSVDIYLYENSLYASARVFECVVCGAMLTGSRRSGVSCGFYDVTDAIRERDITGVVCVFACLCGN